jgi:hypothetical protein
LLPYTSLIVLLRASLLVRSFAFTGVFGIIGGITFSHGTFGNIFCCTHWVLDKGVTPDTQGFCCVAVVSGCVHTLLPIACCCACIRHGENPVIGFTSTTLAETGFQLAGGNNFNVSSIVWMIFGVRAVLPPDRK